MRRDLSQRRQNEAALLHTWMGENQMRRRYGLRATLIERDPLGACVTIWQHILTIEKEV